MRQSQCDVLENLKAELERIPIKCPQSEYAYEFMVHLSENIVELNDPEPQLLEIRNIFEKMRQEPLPETMDEFLSRTLIYHIFSDLEEFLFFNKRFIGELNERQIKEYRS